MSGDIDQYNSLAFWTNRMNKTAHLCINGEWNEDILPYLKPLSGSLQIVCNTLDRTIQWHVDRKFIKETKMPKSCWDQSLYFFAGLMGKNCSIKILRKG